MPSTHSKPMKHAETTNPLRKYKKKLRQAKTEEQRLKAERMIRIHTPKPKKDKVPKKQEMTEDQLLDKMIRTNEKLRNNQDFITQQQQADVKRLYLEQGRKLNRENIKNLAKERKEQEEKNKKKQLEDYEQYKQHDKTTNEHLQAHKQFLLDYSEQTGAMNTFLEKHKGNKKKADKEFKSQTVKMCRFLEYMICEKLLNNELSYDEVKQQVYDSIGKTMKQSESKSEFLQLSASL